MGRIRAAGGEALGIGTNIADEEQAAAAVERVASELGAPTVLVNNAGIIRDNMLFKMTRDDFESVLGVHLTGNFLMTRAVQGHMVEQKFGRIISLVVDVGTGQSRSRRTTRRPRPGSRG